MSMLLLKTSRPHFKVRRLFVLSLLPCILAQIILMLLTSPAFAVKGSLLGTISTAVLYALYLYSESSRKDCVQLQGPTPQYTGPLLLAASVNTIIFAMLCSTKQALECYWIKCRPHGQCVKLYANSCYAAAFAVILFVTIVVLKEEILEVEKRERQLDSDLEMEDFIKLGRKHRDGSSPYISSRFTA